MATSGNILRDLPPAAPGAEAFQDLWRRAGVRIERIVSTGQATAPGEWLDQPQDEWVMLASGAAGLLIEGESGARALAPGDWVLLPAHRRHRVEWTAPGEATVWLAVHVVLAPNQGDDPAM